MLSILETDTDPETAVKAVPLPPVEEIVICPLEADVIVTLAPATIYERPSTRPVSYTHLTLPTNREV